MKIYEQNYHYIHFRFKHGRHGSSSLHHQLRDPKINVENRYFGKAMKIYEQNYHYIHCRFKHDRHGSLCINRYFGEAKAMNTCGLTSSADLSGLEVIGFDLTNIRVRQLDSVYNNDTYFLRVRSTQAERHLLH